MANISQVEVNNTTYSICDAVARDSISQINDSLSNKAGSGTGADANIYRISSGAQKFAIAATAEDGHRYGLIVHSNKLGMYDFTDQASEWTMTPGIYLHAAWTATSSSANNTRLTNSITLPAGTWVIVAKMPVCSVENFYVGLSYGGVPFSAQVCSQGTSTWIMSLTSQQIVYLMSTQSATMSFSSIERGSIKAIKMA